MRGAFDLTCHPDVRFSVDSVDVARTVKQVAARVGLPERTVRYYDRIGLVAPARSAAGYRLYGPEEEGKLRFVRQAKSLGFSLDDVRALIVAAERGCCGEVIPALQRLLDQKVAQLDEKLVELTEFRDRLVAFRAAQGRRCGCGGDGAFCGCLNGASSSAMPPVPNEGRTPPMQEATETTTITAQSCGCGTNGGGCGCGCDGSCGCGTAASGSLVPGEPAQPSTVVHEIGRQAAEPQRR